LQPGINIVERERFCKGVLSAYFGIGKSASGRYKALCNELAESMSTISADKTTGLTLAFSSKLILSSEFAPTRISGQLPVRSRNPRRALMKNSFRRLKLGAIDAHSGQRSPSIERDMRNGETLTASFGAVAPTKGATVLVLLLEAGTAKTLESTENKRVTASEMGIGIVNYCFFEDMGGRMTVKRGSKDHFFNTEAL
jgi:hypothetical protein